MWILHILVQKVNWCSIWCGKKCGEQIYLYGSILHIKTWLQSAFSMKFICRAFTPEAQPVGLSNNKVVKSSQQSAVLLLLIRRANGPHFLPRLRVMQNLRHIKNGPLFSSVMLCQAEVSLGKCRGSAACIRLCLAELPFRATFVWSENCKPGGQSQKVLESACLFSARNPGVEVSDPPESEQSMGLINQPTFFHFWDWS